MMHEYRFFIDYPEWRAQFGRDIWNEHYHVQQLRLFMFEIFLSSLGQPLAPTMTWELAQKGVRWFYKHLLTDQSKLIANQWPSIVFWFGESGFWESELSPRFHLAQIQDYVQPGPTGYPNNSYAAQYALDLMEYGLPARELATSKAWRLLSDEINGGLGRDWVNEFYYPPHLIWKGEMYHSCRFSVPNSSFLYPEFEIDNQ